MLALRMTRAEPRRLPLAIFLMKPGTSICAGQAFVQGASKQYRQRFASTTASRAPSAGWISANLASNCCSSVISRLSAGQRAIHVRPPVAIELPCLPHLGNQIEIQIRGQHLIPIARSLRHDLSARIAEIARSVELE